MAPNDIEQAISVKKAYDNAKEFAREMIGSFPFSLEEVDRGEYKGTPVWEITLGYPRLEQSPLPAGYLGAGLFGPSPTAYKRFFVNLRTGEIMSMKLREPLGS